MISLCSVLLHHGKQHTRLCSLRKGPRNYYECMNRKLNFTEHVILLYNKANQRFGLLKRTCHFIDNTARRRVLYLSMVRSIFEHCPTVWRPSAYTATNKLETI